MYRFEKEGEKENRKCKKTNRKKKKNCKSLECAKCVSGMGAKRTDSYVSGDLGKQSMMFLSCAGNAIRMFCIDCGATETLEYLFIEHVYKY